MPSLNNIFLVGPGTPTPSFHQTARVTPVHTVALSTEAYPSASNAAPNQAVTQGDHTRIQRPTDSAAPPWANNQILSENR
jgi:hypothetical protein